MPSNEVYPNPTVKQVLFQVRFPNLFFIENKIGEYQLKIMNDFPESSLSIQKQMIVAVGAEKEIVKTVKDAEIEPGSKIWEFKSPSGVQLQIQHNSLTLISNHHKSYQADPTDRFRDVIELTVGSLVELVPIPTMTRVGLRYIDECPIPERTSERFAEYYQSTFPLERFPIEGAAEMVFRTVAERGQYKLRYVEKLQISEDGASLSLDFDAWSSKIPSDQVLAVTDELHEIIYTEFNRTIRQPVIDHMRNVTGS